MSGPALAIFSLEFNMIVMILHFGKDTSFLVEI